MNTTLAGKGLFDALAGSLASGLANLIERVFGPQVHRTLAGAISWADLGATACLLSLVLLANGLAVWLLRGNRNSSEPQPQPAAWRAQLIHAAGKPLYLLIWICGLYVAAAPLLLKLAPEETAADHPIQLLFDRLFNLGVFVALLWFFFRATRVMEARMVNWSSKTESRLDDILVPLLGRSLRVIVPVLGIIFALPVIGLPAAYTGTLGKASSVLLIGTVGWILFQAIHFGEKAVLARYDIKAADNLQARKVYTQIHVLSKTLYVVVALFAGASILMLFEEVRRFGTSLLASAGVIGIIVGFAAQRTIANLFAGFQLAMTQPIRLDDVVIVENEWGRIEEITLTYVVVHIWDQRRLIVPLSHFIEKPFQNWTRVSAELLGSVFVWVDYSLPLEEVRRATRNIVESSPLWDRRFWNLQVTDANERAMQIRVLATSADASQGWDLRCEIREKLIGFIQQRCRESLPRLRADLAGNGANGRADQALPFQRAQ